MKLKFSNNTNGNSDDLVEKQVDEFYSEQQPNKPKKVIFISLPMNGMDPEDIQENLNRAQFEYLRRFNLSVSEVCFKSGLDVYVPAPESLYKLRRRVWHLGNSIQALAGCNEVFFYGDWENARGCRIEWYICREYGIPYVEV